MLLKGKNIVLGVTGSIAAYKAAELASQLTKSGTSVYTIMTAEACELITAFTFRSLTGNPVVTAMFDTSSEFAIEHVSLAQAADIVLIAPATANTIAKLAAGIADDMICCTVLATKAPVVIAPAMNSNMYENPATQENIERLRQRGCTFVGPDSGWLACGMTGAGRMAETDDILDTLRVVLGRRGDLAGKKVVVTAGGTQEPLDPVRVLTNLSSGKMGYAIAVAARDRGAVVTLISATTHLRRPTGISVFDVKTAEEMYKATKKATGSADVLIMAAAVADYRPARYSARKIKKIVGPLSLELERTRDVLATLSGPFFRVGFAAESNDVISNARSKLAAKKLDLIVANDITESGSGFGSDTCHLIIVSSTGKDEDIGTVTKAEGADRVLDAIKKHAGRRQRRRRIA